MYASTCHGHGYKETNTAQRKHHMSYDTRAITLRWYESAVYERGHVAVVHFGEASLLLM